MKSRGVPFYVVASSNHASISERLPFLALNASDPTPFKKKSIVSTQELSQWATDQNDSWPRELDTLYDSYMSLLDNEIRRAWVSQTKRYFLQGINSAAVSHVFDDQFQHVHGPFVHRYANHVICGSICDGLGAQKTRSTRA